MGGPYAPQAALIGGVPSTSVDAPITSIFLVLFVIAGAAHMTILQINLKRGKKFLVSGMLFGFCISRVAAATMRLVWSTHTSSIQVAIAAQIFIAAGVLLLFIINLIFTQRVLRAAHPEFAWAKWFSVAFKVYYASVVVMIVALITCVIQSFYTLSTNTHRIDRHVQLVGQTYFAVTAFLPIPLIALHFLLPRTTRVEKFGSGRFRTKIFFILFTACLLTLGAAFRTGIAFYPRPRSNPAWYHSKACFYLFNFTIEIITVYLFIFIRVDKRFIVPDGSKGPGDYASKEAGLVRGESLSERVNVEEEVFDDETRAERKAVDVEAGQQSARSSATTVAH